MNEAEYCMFGRDKICGVVAAGDAVTMMRELGRALRLTRTVELRLDYLRDDAQISHFLRLLAAKKSRATLIATCRRREAGGLYRGTAARQLVHL
ncbi:MAG: type I 3-dehydroquinate dehydratase, partial [Candidatus Acidiferrales bacterium]